LLSNIDIDEVALLRGQQEIVLEGDGIHALALEVKILPSLIKL